MEIIEDKETLIQQSVVDLNYKEKYKGRTLKLSVLAERLKATKEGLKFVEVFCMIAIDFGHFVLISISEQNI